MDPIDVLEVLGLDGQAVGAKAEPSVRRAVADGRSLTALRGLPPVGPDGVGEVVLHPVVARNGNPFPGHTATCPDLAPLGVAAHVCVPADSAGCSFIRRFKLSDGPHHTFRFATSRWSRFAAQQTGPWRDPAP